LVDVVDIDEELLPDVDAISLSPGSSPVEEPVPAELVEVGAIDVAILTEVGVSDAGMLLEYGEFVIDGERRTWRTRLHLWLR
jgi:hypothetical protein